MNEKKQQVCGVCNGSGWVQRTVTITEYEDRTITEQIPVQVGDHVEWRTVTRVEQVPVTRTVFEDVLCATCGGDGKV